MRTFALLLMMCSVSLVPVAYADTKLTPTQQWSKAISNDDAEKLLRLLAHSLLVNSADTQESTENLLKATAPNGKTALMVASKRGDLSLARALMAVGARVNRVTQTGGNAFMFAVLGNHIDLAKWLAEQGANVGAVGSNGWSAVTIAAAMGHNELLAWLTTQDTPIDKADVYRFTPLMRAADNGHLTAAKLLIDSKAVDVNAADEWQNTALHFVINNKNGEMLALLLESGADMQKPNRDGITPASMMSRWPAAQQIVDRYR